jgi:hypothetical protein
MTSACIRRDRVEGLPNYNLLCRSRSELPTTLAEDSAMAAAAMIGESRMPNIG